MKYAEALQIQEQHRDKLLSGQSDRQIVYTVEHPPTITIGRNGSFTNIVASREVLERIGMEVFEVDRGGDVTYHGPGQLVVYPVLHLEPWGSDVARYVRMLEEVVIRALKSAGIDSDRLNGYPGVWIGNEKICAIGARMRRRPNGEYVTSHGFALNVSTDLSHFETIIPCGLVDKGVTSVEKIIGAKPSMAEWEQRVLASFADVFEADVIPAPHLASGA
jgi:lipoyl(octanoyl) transferase